MVLTLRRQVAYYYYMKLKKVLSSLAVVLLLSATPVTALAAAAVPNCPSDTVEIGIPILTVKGITQIKDSTGKVVHTCVANDAASGGAIVVYLKAFLQYLSGLVGLVIVLMIVISGIQYITAYGDPGRIKGAKTRLTNALIGLFLFIGAFAILSFIIPGGIIG